VLNLLAFENAKMQDVPYRWGTVADAFDSPGAVRAVAGSFPFGNLRLRTAKEGGEKAYRMLSVPLAEQGRLQPPAEALDHSWRHLLDEVRSPGFTAAVSAAASVDLGRAALEVRAACYTEGCFLGPHTDRPDKLVSVILYLSARWSAGGGGELSILRSGDPDDECARVEPRPGTAALLVRSDTSWHQVLPVRGAVPRCSLLVHYWA